MAVKDLGSSEGTWIDNRRVGEAEARPGSVVRAGEVRLWIEVCPGEERHSVNEASGEGALPAPVPISFFAAVPGAFSYAAQGEFLGLVGVAAVLTSLQSLLPGGFSILVMVPGFFLGCFLVTLWRAIVVSTAEGDDRIPALGWSMLNWDQTRELMLRCFFLTLLCFGPSSAIRWWDGAPAGLALLLFGLGCLWFPTAFLGLVMTETLDAANPMVVLASIRRAPLANLFLALTLAGGLGLPACLGQGTEPPADFHVWSLVIQAVLSAMVVYLSFVWMRWLGLYYRSEGAPDCE